MVDGQKKRQFASAEANGIKPIKACTKHFPYRALLLPSMLHARSNHSLRPPNSEGSRERGYLRGVRASHVARGPVRRLAILGDEQREASPAHAVANAQYTARPSCGGALLHCLAAWHWRACRAHARQW